MSINTTRVTEFDVANGTGVSTAAAATVNTQVGTITTEALTTAAAATYSFTLTNSLIKVGSVVMVTVAKGTATTGEPAVHFVTPVAGSAVIAIRNDAAAAALNGTIIIGYVVFNVV